jgi:phage replication O-like protein O
MAGYTRFDNPILEKVLSTNFTKRQLKILLQIVRFAAGCQKTYAVLRKNGYAYAGVSPYCITQELEKLVKLRVIKWDTKRDLVWLNPNLQEWTVDRPGEKPGDNLRRFFKIVNKNLLKWQLSVYQNSKSEVTKTAKISGAYKNKKEIVNINYNKENVFLKVLEITF